MPRAGTSAARVFYLVLRRGCRIRFVLARGHWDTAFSLWPGPDRRIYYSGRKKDKLGDRINSFFNINYSALHLSCGSYYVGPAVRDAACGGWLGSPRGVA